MVSSFFDIFRSCSSLVVIFRFNVVNFFARVKKFACPFEVVFHQVYVSLVVIEIDSWVSYEKYAKFVETLSYFLAFKFYFISE
jgi:hypothetical protein